MKSRHLLKKLPRPLVTDEVAQYLSTYEPGPSRPYYKTTPPATLIDHLNHFTHTEKLVFALVVVITLVLRLYGLHYPNSVVFDEVHLGTFLSRYIKGEFLMDVHPPLVKLIYAFIARINGFHADFEFSNIGKPYVDSNGNALAPYLLLRLFSLMCGVATVVVTYKIAKFSGCRPLVCSFGALLCCFENSLTTQARFILLDSPLVFFISLVVLYYKLSQVSVPFSKKWFRYICLLGFAIGLSISSKWVGLFTVAWVALLNLRDFWYLIGDLQVSTKTVFRHFSTRAYFLVITPLILYCGLFAVHFLLLPKVGEGVSHMSSRFQSTLENSIIHDYYQDVLFGSTVSLRHLNTGGYLHSHDAVYPKTGQQQVTLYGFQDANNDWLIEKRTKTNASELFDSFTTVSNLQKVRLFHKVQNRYLRVNDQRPPMSEQDYNNEVTLIGDHQYLGDGDNEVFEIKLIVDRSRLHPESKFKLKAVDSVFQIRHVGTNCYLISHDVKLPKWGFDQNEVLCIESPTLENSLWYFEKNTHPLLEKDPEAKRLDLPAMGFWAKLWETHRVMWRINRTLTQEHPFSSSPISWPFVLRGVSYFGLEGKNVYLLGNLVTYWMIVVCIVGLATFLGIKATAFLNPAFFSTGSTIKLNGATIKFINNTLEYTIGWALHYAPSFLMGRQLFLHHYLPSVFFGILAITQTFEFITAKNKLVGYVLMLVVLGSALSFFYKYSPLIYALEWDYQDCEASKLMSTWDFKCAQK